MTTDNNFNEPGFTSALPIYSLQTRCPQNNSGFSFAMAGTTGQQGMKHFVRTMYDSRHEIESVSDFIVVASYVGVASEHACIN